MNSPAPRGWPVLFWDARRQEKGRRRVIRAPAILPDDEAERPTGSLAVPTNNSLEAMVIEDAQQDLLAAARQVPNTTEIQLPDQKAEGPEYVKTDVAKNDATTTEVKSGNVVTQSTDPTLKPIDNGVKTLQLNQTADTSKGIDIAEAVRNNANPTVLDPAVAPSAGISLGAELKEMKAGEKAIIPVLVDGSAPFRSAVLGLKFDVKRLAVRSVAFGDIFGKTAVNNQVTPFLNQNGKMYVSLSAEGSNIADAKGILAYIEVEALVDGKPKISFERDVLNFLTTDGKNFVVKFDK